jgi:hypothetical protein
VALALLALAKSEASSSSASNATGKLTGSITASAVLFSTMALLVVGKDVIGVYKGNHRVYRNDRQ